MSSHEDDETLMLRYRHGDVQAFERLYERYKGALYRYFLRQCGQAAIAEELFQDVWLQLVRMRKHYVARAKFTTYLFHMAHNRLIDYYRRQAVRGTPDALQSHAALMQKAVHQEPEEHLHRQRQMTRLLELVSRLPVEQREAFLLREEAGLSLEAIAEVTGVSRETTKSRLRYAVTRLRRGLRGAE